MTDVDDEHGLFTWAKNERLAILDEIDAFKGGRHVQQRQSGGAWVDVTAHELDRLLRRLGRLDHYIAKHEGS